MRMDETVALSSPFPPPPPSLCRLADSEEESLLPCLMPACLPSVHSLSQFESLPLALTSGSSCITCSGFLHLSMLYFKDPLLIIT